MDLLSFLGVIIGFAAILGGNFLEGGHFSGLINGSAAIIVFGGTFGAAMLQTRMTTMRRAMAMMRWVFQKPGADTGEGMKRLMKWSQVARRDGLLGLEKSIDKEKEDLAKKGLMLLIDGMETDQIRTAMEAEVIVQNKADLAAAKVFEAMGGYAPTIGILGAVMGLIHVMTNLADPAMLGEGIATAFVATIYGVGSANLIFLPFANKLKSVVQLQAQYAEMVIEGVCAIAEGEYPRAMEMRLQAFAEK